MLAVRALAVVGGGPRAAGWIVAGGYGEREMANLLHDPARGVVARAAYAVLEGYRVLLESGRYPDDPAGLPGLLRTALARVRDYDRYAASGRAGSHAHLLGRRGRPAELERLLLPGEMESLAVAGSAIPPAVAAEGVREQLEGWYAAAEEDLGTRASLARQMIKELTATA